MVDLIARLFDTSDFPARWQCGHWTSLHGWTHIIADLAIFSAYAAIPAVLAYFVLLRRDIPYQKVLWLFVAFILSCGLGHLLEAAIFWHPWYRLAAMVKVVTAVVSWATVVALIPLVPQALAWPGLAEVNRALQVEIGERRRAEDRFRQIVEAAPSGMVMVDHQGSILLVNHLAESLFGYPREELLGQPVELLVPERFRAQHPANRNSFFARPETRAMGVGRELFGRRKDGTEFPVEIGLNPIQTETGIWVLSAIVDITERKAAEATRARLAAIVDSADDAIISKDLNGFVTSWNAAAERTFGFRSEEIVGQSIALLIPPERQHEELRILEVVQRGERMHRMETQRRHKDGHEIDVSVTISPIRDSNGNIVGASKIIHDISRRKQIEDALRQSESRKAAILESALDAIITTDHEGKIIEFNPAAERTFGRSRSDAVGKVMVELIFPASLRAAHSQELANSIAIGERPALGKRLETSAMRADGSEFPCELAVTRIATSGPPMFTAYIRDVTERQQAEEKFHLAVESAPNGMVMIDELGQMVLINSQTEALFGYSRNELLGQSIELLVPERFRENHPALRTEFFTSPVARAMGAGRELFGRRKDGSEFPVEIGLNPITTKEGTFVLSAIVDITERKHREHERLASHERFRAVIEKMAEGIVISNLDGQLLHWNRAALNLYGFESSEEWCLRLSEFANIFEISTLEGDLLPLQLWPLSRLLTEQHLQDYEVQVHRTGTEIRRIVSFCGDFVLDASGKRVAFLTMTDVTERRQAEGALRMASEELEKRVIQRTAELASANKELEAFSYSVSHDLRAPLRAIDGFSKILMEDHLAALPAEAQEYLRDVRASTQQMGHLVDDLLAFSRLGRQPVKRELVACDRIVRRCLEELKSESEGRQVEVRVGELAPCSADPALLKQIWINLLSNALKYTGRRPKPLLEIGCQNEDPAGQPIYYVKDNGVGFDMRYAHKLFGVFQRLHRAEDYAGTGVGLAIVQRIVHRHGGRVWAESVPNQGATFYFTLAEGDSSHA